MFFTYNAEVLKKLKMKKKFDISARQQPKTFFQINNEVLI